MHVCAQIQETNHHRHSSHPDTTPDSPEYGSALTYLEQLEGVSLRHHEVRGDAKLLTEIYLIGDTQRLDQAAIESLDVVERVIRISEPYRILGRHKDEQRVTGFSYNDLRFDQDNLHLIAGLCAVDTPRHVEQMLQALQSMGAQCTRMGAYKPRTNPYSFQGHGRSCLPWVSELAGKYGMRVVAMEVTHESQVEERLPRSSNGPDSPPGSCCRSARGTRRTSNC